LEPVQVRAKSPPFWVVYWTTTGGPVMDGVGAVAALGRGSSMLTLEINPVRLFRYLLGLVLSLFLHLLWPLFALVACLVLIEVLRRRRR
jgi:hypothetical protein